MMTMYSFFKYVDNIFMKHCQQNDLGKYISYRYNVLKGVLIRSLEIYSAISNLIQDKLWHHSGCFLNTVI